jgi:hypothetical protein
LRTLSKPELRRLEEQRDCTEELLFSGGFFPFQMLLNLKEARSRILAFSPAFLTTTFSEKPRIQFWEEQRNQKNNRHILISHF